MTGSAETKSPHDGGLKNLSRESSLQCAFYTVKVL